MHHPTLQLSVSTPSYTTTVNKHTILHYNCQQAHHPTLQLSISAPSYTTIVSKHTILHYNCQQAHHPTLQLVPNISIHRFRCLLTKKTMTLAIMARGKLDQEMFMTSKTFIWLMQDHVKHTHYVFHRICTLSPHAWPVDKRPHPHCQGRSSLQQLHDNNLPL